MVEVSNVVFNSDCCRMMIGPEEFDPTHLDADQIMVELEVGPSVLMVYGTLLRCFLHIKVSYSAVNNSTVYLFVQFGIHCMLLHRAGSHS